MLARQFILLTVVHATRSKGFPGPNITASSTLSALATTDESEYGKDDVSKSHDTNSGDKPDDEALVFTVAQVNVTLYTIAATEGTGRVGASIIAGGGVGRSQGGVGGGVGGVRRGPRGDVRLELPGGLLDTGDFTACGAFLESVCDVIGDLLGKLLNFGLVDVEGGGENISGHAEESLGDCVYTGEGITEESDESDRLATVVVLEMDCTLGEEGGLVGENLVEDELSAILGDHAGDE